MCPGFLRPPTHQPAYRFRELTGPFSDAIWMEFRSDREADTAHSASRPGIGLDSLKIDFW
jgi:hypothetical protein